jgi:hypothetical protein
VKLKRTLRTRKFIDAYIDNNGNATKAFLAISPQAKNPRQYGYRMLQKVDISVSEFLDKAGMDDIHLSKKLKEGLDATKVISVIPIPPKEARPGTGDLPDANSKNIDFVDVPDFNVRVKYLDMAYKLKDKFPAERHKIDLPEEMNIKVTIKESGKK